MPEIILPCPACGAVENESDKFGLSYRLGVQIVCHKCGMYGPVAEDFNEAVGKWNALPRALRWTKETPNVAGKMYLAKGLDLIVYVLKIIEVNGVLYAQFPDGKECRMSYFFEWAGPIPAPLEE